jgi:uncharacterized integral membrane protein
MSFCFCRLLLPVLVIVFAWLGGGVTWSKIALTVVGALLVVLAVGKDVCCCAAKKEKQEQESAQ